MQRLLLVVVTWILWPISTPVVVAFPKNGMAITTTTTSFSSRRTRQPLLLVVPSRQSKTTTTTSTTSLDLSRLRDFFRKRDESKGGNFRYEPKEAADNNNNIPPLEEDDDTTTAVTSQTEQEAFTEEDDDNNNYYYEGEDTVHQATESIQDRINRVKSGRMTDEEKEAFLRSVLSTQSTPESRKPLRMAVPSESSSTSSVRKNASPFPSDSILREMASGNGRNKSQATTKVERTKNIRTEEVQRVSLQKQKREYLDMISDPNRFSHFGVINPMSKYRQGEEEQDDNNNTLVDPQVVSSEDTETLSWNDDDDDDELPSSESLAERLEAAAHSEEMKRKQKEEENAKRLEEERKEREKKLQEIARQRREEQRRREAVIAEQMRREEEARARQIEEEKRKERERIELLTKKQEEYWKRKLAEEKKAKERAEAEMTKQLHSREEEKETPEKLPSPPKVEDKRPSSPSFNPDESKLLDEAEEERREIKLENEQITNKAAGLDYRDIHPTLKESKLSDRKKKEDALIERLRNLSSPLPKTPEKKGTKNQRPIMQMREKPPVRDPVPRSTAGIVDSPKFSVPASGGVKPMVGSPTRSQSVPDIFAATRPETKRPASSGAAKTPTPKAKTGPIRMELPLTDDDEEDDDFDARASGEMTISEVMKRRTSSSVSQEERSKKWGIDISKFT